ncbi:putative defense protein [Zootermopsis nevadensis]|uniref:putative defense protein n=1 Tax=Zootermopsis nevadensis TaxID=136037 RepID=UPI000B8E9DA8|nr:putative defense protein [Zootermopsis nevadensis]
MAATQGRSSRCVEGGQGRRGRAEYKTRSRRQKDTSRIMKAAAGFSVVVACLFLAAGSPVPEDVRPISFAVTVTPPTTSLKGLIDAHENISSVCASMLPAHGNAQAQNSDAPYKVELSDTTVAPGGVVTVEFSGVGEQQFKGLYVQARSPQDVQVGHFLPSEDKHVTLSSCGSGQDNAVSYISYDSTPAFSFRWVAPDEPTTVTITATIVETFSKFWVAVRFGSVEVKN